MNKFIIKLTQVEMDDLIRLIQRNQQEGTYWGNKERYWKRINRIERTLATMAIEKFVRKEK